MSKISIETFNNLIASELPLAADTGIYLKSVEHGLAEMVFRRLLQPVRAMAHHVSERAGEHAHLAVECGHPAKG